MREAGQKEITPQTEAEDEFETPVRDDAGGDDDPQDSRPRQLELQRKGFI